MVYLLYIVFLANTSPREQIMLHQTKEFSGKLRIDYEARSAKSCT